MGFKNVAKVAWIHFEFLREKNVRRVIWNFWGKKVKVLLTTSERKPAAMRIDVLPSGCSLVHMQILFPFHSSEGWVYKKVEEMINDVVENFIFRFLDVVIDV